MSSAVEQAKLRRERARCERFIQELERTLATERERLVRLQRRCSHPDRRPASAEFDVADYCPDCGAVL